MQVALEAIGSSNNIYDVIVLTDEEKVTRLICSCSAGVNGMMCKHRAALLENKPGEIFINQPLFENAVHFLAQSGMTTAHARYQKLLADLDKEAKKIKKNQHDEKHAYIRILEGDVNKYEAFDFYSLRRLTLTEP